MNRTVTTQISSKYSPHNSGVFAFKERLEQCGYQIAFPAGSLIIEYIYEFAITIPSEKTTPFHLTQRSFFNEVKKNPVHIVYNIFNLNQGYIGESTAVEIAYALLHNAPIILVRDSINYGGYVYSPIKELINKYLPEMHIIPLDTITSPERLKEYIEKSMNRRKCYNLTQEEQRIIKTHVLKLESKYKDTWDMYKKKI